MERGSLLLRLSLSLNLAVLSAFLVECVDKWIPYSRVRDHVTDALRAPGGVIASLLYPQGTHTGTGAPLWSTVALFANFALYSVFWYTILLLMEQLRRHKGERSRVNES